MTGDESSTDGTEYRMSRRDVVRAVGATGLGLGGVAASGVGSGAPDALPHLERLGNWVVGPCHDQVTLRGVNLVDPVFAMRRSHGKTVPEMIAHATNDDWATNVVRLPMRPEFISAADDRGAADRSNDSFIDHGDHVGPILPGQLDDDEIQAYFEKFVDPAVEAAREAGVYVQLSYYREWPIFYQQLDGSGTDAVDACSADTFENDLGRCGQRGVLWHGADQVAELQGLQATQEDAFYEDAATCEALDEEVRAVWTAAADRYAGDEDSHVLFDLFSKPMAPYAGAWGAASGTLPSGPGKIRTDVRAETSAPFWRLFLERAAPWIELVAEKAPDTLLTIGSPRYSQYTYWAKDVGANHVDNALPDVSDKLCYSFHRNTHEILEPMADYVGPAAERVPIMCNEFGWAAGGGANDYQFVDGSTGAYPEGVDRAEDWPEVEEKANQAADYEALFDEYPIHAIASAFDHSRAPAFFAGDSFETLRPYDEAPGRWWREYLAAHADADDHAPGTCEHETRNALGHDIHDPDLDGDFEDLSGNREIDNQDVVAYFQSMGTGDDPGPLAEDGRRRFFDYTDNGEIDYQDLISLFSEI